MIISFIGNIFISFIILGYSFFFKILFFPPKNQYIKNFDFLYGIFFLILLIIIINFFLPVEKIKIIFYLIGIFFFILGNFKKKIQIKFLGLAFFLFLFSFFSYWNGNNVDSPIYHLQTINWIHNYKVTFGLAILDWHYALNSVWHIFLSLFSLDYKKFNFLYVVNFIPFAFIFNELFENKNKFSISYFTLFFSTCFLFIFSYLHPFNNGIIFNHLGNPEVDTIGMIFFIAAGYLFLNFLEKKESNSYYLLIVCTVICILIKLTYIGSFLFLIVIFAKYYKKIKIFNLVSFLGSVLVVIWMIRNFILSSCLIFPFKFTCFNSGWSLSKNQVDFYLNQTKSFARDTPLRDKYLNFDYTLNSFDWIIPWIKSYFISDAFLLISFTIFIFSLICSFFIYIKNFLKKKKYELPNFYYSFIILYLINFIIWFQAPEIRFGWGVLIFFPCLFLSLIIYEQSILKKVHFNIFPVLVIIFGASLIVKNFNKFTLNNLINPINKTYDYSKIKSLLKTDEIELFLSTNWKCGDFKQPCLYKVKKNYIIEFKNNYLFIQTSDKETL